MADIEGELIDDGIIDEDEIEDDDLLIDDGGDDYLIYDEYEDEDEVITNEYDGYQTTVRRGWYTRDTSFSRTQRCFTQIDGGVLKFGDRNVSTGARTVRYNITPAYITVGATNYYGISIDAAKMDIYTFISSDADFKIRAGSNYGFTGYMSVVTDVQRSQEYGFRWTVEKLPFRNGICIARR